jgi:hypothetical protein
MKFDILHTFISPVTGRVLSIFDYVLVGDRNGVAIPSPALIDLRLDLINLRRGYNILSNADVVVGTPNEQLPNAQVLSFLDDGYMINTGGVVSTAPAPSGGFAPARAKYILKTADVLLPNAQSLKDVFDSSPYIGLEGEKYILKVVSDGSVSLAEAYTDYVTQHTLEAELENYVTEDELDDILENYVTETELEETVLELEGEIALVAAAAEVAQTTADAALAVATGAAATAGTALGLATTANERLDDLKLNEIPASDNVSIDGHKLINVADPTNSQDAATKNYVDNAISGIPGSTTIVLEGDVTGSGPLSAPVVTTLALTLDEIPIAENAVNLNDQRIKNLQQSPDEDFDAVSATFLWDLMHDRVEILWP